MYLPQLQQAIHAIPNRCRCNRPRGHDALLGRNPGGSWRTAAAKHCPPDMCRILAQALFASSAPNQRRQDQWNIDDLSDLSDDDSEVGRFDDLIGGTKDDSKDKAAKKELRKAALRADRGGASRRSRRRPSP